ncbi:MAG: hypothetical protein AAFZ63_03520 [Bacteroidota bacterium]
MMKRLLGVILFLPFLYLLQLNIRLWYQPSIQTEAAGRYNIDLYHQLKYLRIQMHEKDAAQSMQEFYPEGFVFTHALYALSWVGLVESTTDEYLRQEAIEEVRWSLTQLETDEAREIFPADMSTLPYGVFYQGWVNYTRGRYLGILVEPAQDSVQLARFQTTCTQIAHGIERHHTPFLFSYHFGCWPADNVVALTSLSLHDQLFPARFDEVRKGWLAQMREKMDEFGLLPHQVDLSTGATVENARGSSQSLMLAFWPLIDSTFAQDQYKRYQRHFVDERLGLPGIREYAHGISAAGDIDAGPVIWDIGGSASVVGMGTVAQYKDAALYAGLRNSMEGFGGALTFRKKKRYLLGQLPMADAFIAWSHSRVPPELWGAHRPIRFTTILSLTLPMLLLGLLIWYSWKPVKRSVK